MAIGFVQFANVVHLNFMVILNFLLKWSVFIYGALRTKSVINNYLNWNSNMKKISRIAQRSPLAAAVAISLFAAPMAHAFDFEKGGLTGSFDTSVSYGVSVRAGDQAEDLIGKATINPNAFAYNQTFAPPFNSLGTFSGSAAQEAMPGRWSTNRDDGNVKYDKGDLFSNAFKITSELELNYGNWGVFARASYFYDFTNTQDKYADYMTDIAQERVGTNFDMYDYFIFNNYAIGANDEITGSVRLGNQVVSWGESTFIQNGINVINPVDLSRLRVAGAELKEALLPTGMIWGSIQFNEAFSMEAYYQYEWEGIRIDPSGTYFSANDFASPGGQYIMLGFGTVPGPVINPDLFSSTCSIGQNAFGQIYTPNPGVSLSNSDAGLTLTQTAVGCGVAGARLSPDREPSDTGQFGVALRWFAEDWNQTEFGFYAMNYHSKAPLLSGQAAYAFPLASNGPGSSASPPPNTAASIVEYPEDIHLLGVSFNTTLPGGVAWQGEFSYRPNMPFQIDDVELLFAALTPLNQVIAASPASVFPSMYFTSQMGSFSSGAYIKGYEELAMSQLQMTFTKAFSQVLGASQVALVAEIGATQVDLPDPSVLRFEGEGTDTGGGVSLANDLRDTINAYNAAPSAATAAALQAALLNPLNAGALRNPITQVDGFPTDFSWGYRLAARATYDSVGGSSITLIPRLAFAHDVNGITPGPGGNFLEGRTNFTIGLEAIYLQDWSADISYTGFGGAGDLNQIHDRDYYSFSIKYSF